MNQNDFFHWARKGCKFARKSKPNLKPVTEENKNETLEENMGTDDTQEIKKPAVNLSQMEQKMNEFRNKHNIRTWGTDILPPIETFDALIETHNVNPRLIENLKAQGYEEPRPIQMQAWPMMMAGREILGCAPTGSGKTTAFMLPVIHHLKKPRKKGFRAVVVAPTRELAKQLYRECLVLTEGLDFNIRILGNLSKDKHKYGPKSAKKFDILIATPQLLVHLIDDTNNRIDLSKVEWLVVDESDKLFEDGKHSFRDQLAKIYKACSKKNVLRAFFSATFTQTVEQWCKVSLNNPAMVIIGKRQAACKDVEQELVYCGNNDLGKDFALMNILNEGYEPPCLIFVDSKDRAKNLFMKLFLDKRMVGDIHSDRPKAQRDNLIKSFREGKIWILVCTELMARGIDFKGVNLVINYDMPMDTVSYIHRIGRTGRSGHKGRAITFVSNQDISHVRGIAEVMKVSGSKVPEHFLTNFTKEEKRSLIKKFPDPNYAEMKKMKKVRRNKKKKRLQKPAKKV